MAFIDYYKIMGIPRDTPQKDIRLAFKKRAKQFHPDLHPDDPKAKAKFQALNEAYDVLNDPEKRRKYDQYGEHWRDADAFNQAGGFHAGTNGSDGFEGFDFSQFSGGGGFSSFFENLFGGGSNSFRRPRHEATMNVTVTIDLYTALLGGSIILRTANGSSLKLKVKPETQNGSKVRLRGRGYDRGDGSFGDMIVTYNIQLPTGLTEKQRELLREMQKAGA